MSICVLKFLKYFNVLFTLYQYILTRLKSILKNFVKLKFEMLMENYIFFRLISFPRTNA